MFDRLASLARLIPPPGRYQRLWTPVVTLWYLIWQRLQPQHTLEAVVTDARRGGADRLSPKGKTLSRRIQSRATTAYSDARQGLPLAWVYQCFLQLAQQLRGPAEQTMAVEVLDGSTVRFRPHGDLAAHFPPHGTRSGKSYWCLGRVLVSFCVRSGVAVRAALAAGRKSEQALAVQLMLEARRNVLYIGDRNFGVWRVVRAAAQSGGQALFRLTQVRARRLLGKKRLPGLADLPCVWSPTAHDQVDPGLTKAAVAGRLILIQAARPGYRPQALYLFTTLTDAQAYPPKRLLEMYGWRWQAELNFRTVKATLQMDQFEVKSADMARKEFYAGLMAFNLVRGLMAAAAQQAGVSTSQLSFTKVRLLLAAVLLELWREGMSHAAVQRRLVWLLAEAAAARLPRRAKPRPSEPRAQYYEPQVFPKMKGSRAQMRRKLNAALQKS